MSPIVTIGNLSLGLAFASSLLGIVFYASSRLLQASPHKVSLASWGRATIYGNFILMTIATLAMVYGLLSNDFGVSYVAEVGSRETPRWVSAISLWSSLDGSILFWIFLLTTLSAVCIYWYRERQESLFASVGLVLLATQIFFYILLALPANPFRAVIPAPMNGPGPNPLLQNHWLMGLHPPTLYIGYIGFTIPFAFAVASLMDEEFPTYWVTLIRKWTLFAWSFLSLAIVLGGWWSYAVLGWGGYWAWDPVENASLMPWLAGTALVHSIMVQEKRNLFCRWNLFLAILTFLLTLLGTFLTRSGVLDSVHSFTESDIGPYFLVFIALIFAVSIALLLWRSPKMPRENKIESLFSLEVFMLFNNLLFLCLCLIVITGTLYPIAAEIISGTKISVGEPYFNQMTVPLTALVLMLMSVGFIVPWRQGDPKKTASQIAAPFVLSLLLTCGLAGLGLREIPVLIFVFLILFAALVMFMRRPRFSCGMLAHLGILLLLAGVTFSSQYEKEQELTLKVGESASLGAYEFVFEGMSRRESPQRFEVRANVTLLKNDREIKTLTPQLNFYPLSQQPIASPAIHSTLIQDFYVTLISFEQDGSKASLRLMISPAVSWIWIAGFVLLGSGLLGVFWQRRKVL